MGSLVDVMQAAYEGAKYELHLAQLSLAEVQARANRCLALGEGDEARALLSEIPELTASLNVAAVNYSVRGFALLDAMRTAIEVRNG